MIVVLWLQWGKKCDLLSHRDKRFITAQSHRKTFTLPQYRTSLPCEALSCTDWQGESNNETQIKPATRAH